MILKYGINIDHKIVINRMQNLLNQIYKLLPSRQQGIDWQRPLDTIIQEIAGMYRLMNGKYSQVYFPLLNKLEGLYSLTNEDDFSCYRRIIFECLSLMNTLQKKICQDQQI